MNLVELAQRIKKLRLDRGMTLDQAATRTGLTGSWLSKVENFRVTPSLPALARIADALGITVSQLVEDLDRKPKLIRVKPGERMVVERDQGISDITYESLAFKRPDRQMDPFVLTLPPGHGRSEALPHEGEEFLYVLEGTTDFEYDGDCFTLHAGDALYFDAMAPHRLMNRSQTTAKVMCVFWGLGAEQEGSRAIRIKTKLPPSLKGGRKSVVKADRATVKVP